VGVLTPAVAREKEDGRYELVSGHRRKHACELAGLDAMPVIVREMSHDEAVIFMVESNFQRETLLPSEKAFAYKMRLDAMSRQGQRTCRPVVDKLKSVDVIGEKTGESGRQIQRYIRLNSLIPEIQTMVDDGNMAFRPAVELSYLPKEQQQELLTTIETEEATPSLAQAIKMKKFSQENRLNEDVILSIMSEEKPNQKEQIKIPRERINKYFKEGTPTDKITEIIIKALDFYRKREREDRNER
jgi:ParB family chromosome partitioning protein